MTKIKIYLTLDVLLESENYAYVLSNKSYKVNNLLIKAMEDIAKEYEKLVDIVIVCKGINNRNEILDFIKKLNFKFNYSIIYTTNNEILNLHKDLTKNEVLIDIDDELLYRWILRRGKSIKYLNTKEHKRCNLEFLHIKDNFETSSQYYQKLTSYIHLCH